MSYLGGAGLSQDYRNNIKAKGSVLNTVGCKKILGDLFQLSFFNRRDSRLSWLETFSGSCFYLDKDDSSIGVDHDKVEFASFTGEIADQFAQAFSF